MNEVKRVAKGIIIPGIFTTFFWLMIFGKNLSGNLREFWVYWFISMLIWILIGFSIVDANNSYKKKYEEEARKTELKRVEAFKVYFNIKEKMAIPDDAAEVNCMEGNGIQYHDSCYMWLSENNICFFPKYSLGMDSLELEQNLKLYQIRLSDIEYYSFEGEIYRENQLSGGGGGGSSIGGAVIGGVIAGEAGAIIGSRKAGTPITSTLVTHDDRRVSLYYKEFGKLKALIFKPDDLREFEKLIPEKALPVINAVRTANAVNKQITNMNPKSITDKIRDLSVLYNEGILTEEEFTAKKKELLAQLI